MNNDLSIFPAPSNSVNTANTTNSANAVNLNYLQGYGHLHHHTHCHHSLNFCYQCDVAYCVNCGAEFSRKTNAWLSAGTTTVPYNFAATAVATLTTPGHAHTEGISINAFSSTDK